MKTFRFTADCAFEAGSLEEAFSKLAYHFLSLVDGRESELDQIGSMDIRKIQEATKNEV